MVTKVFSSVEKLAIFLTIFKRNEFITANVRQLQLKIERKTGWLYVVNFKKKALIIDKIIKFYKYICESIKKSIFLD